jgi:hypothetical protein
MNSGFGSFGPSLLNLSGAGVAGVPIKNTKMSTMCSGKYLFCQLFLFKLLVHLGPPANIPRHPLGRRHNPNHNQKLSFSSATTSSTRHKASQIQSWEDISMAVTEMTQIRRVHRQRPTVELEATPATAHPTSDESARIRNECRSIHPWRSRRLPLQRIMSWA